MDFVQRHSVCLVIISVLFTSGRTAFIPSKSEETTEVSTTLDVVQTAENLDEIPRGNADVQMLNIAYNEIVTLSEYVFYNNSYRALKKINLSENKINNISMYAFRGLKSVKTIDLAGNNISTFDPYTFKANTRLRSLYLMNNFIVFDRLQTFLVSQSIETLILTNNKIDQIYELTFLGVPNIKNLYVNNNDLTSIAPNSFKPLQNLRYLSLANTRVYRLSGSMFGQLPRILNIEDTPFANKFSPPLKKVRSDAVARLININQYLY